jgi:ferric-dicitrate binding protein FerR (iron transport regulator)
MSMTSTIKGYGSAARFRAGSMGHRAKDRMLEKRLDRATHESDRLRFENDMLRDEVEEARTEHRRILDLLEERLPEEHEEEEHHSHKGRWLIFLLALGGAAFAVFRQLRPAEEWNADHTGATA